MPELRMSLNCVFARGHSLRNEGSLLAHGRALPDFTCGADDLTVSGSTHFFSKSNLMGLHLWTACRVQFGDRSAWHPHKSA